MTDAHSPRTRPIPNAKLPTLTALVPAGILLWHLGWPVSWPALLLPTSLALFTFVWTDGLMRLVSRRWALLSGLLVGAVAAHLMLWLPFVFVSYMGGQGTGRMGYNAMVGLVTAAAVGWYILADHLWQTLLFFGALGGVVTWLRPRGTKGSAGDAS